MSETTPALNLPLIAEDQAQKHVTHNEALEALDALVQATVASRATAAPPATPNEGDAWIVATSASGDWAGHDGEIASFRGGGWLFHAPRKGWLVHVADEDVFAFFDGAQWVELGAAIGALQSLLKLGINAAADDTNRLAVKSDAVLFSHDDASGSGTGDMRVKLNKAAPVNTASVLFQTGWSGRAEMGLTGDDDFSIRVSQDGSAWHEAMIVERDSGNASFRERVSVFSPAGAATSVCVAEEELSLSGSYAESSVVIPNRAIVLGVSTRTTESITGASSYDCGISGEASKFGGSLGVSAGSTNSGVIGPTAFYSDTPVRLSANGGDFTGGKVRIAIHYLVCEVPAA